MGIVKIQSSDQKLIETIQRYLSKCDIPKVVSIRALGESHIREYVLTLYRRVLKFAEEHNISDKEAWERMKGTFWM